jgi:hypothetical protein
MRFKAEVGESNTPLLDPRPPEEACLEFGLTNRSMRKRGAGIFFRNECSLCDLPVRPERLVIGSWLTNSKTKSFPASNPIRFERVAIAERSPRCFGPCSIPEMASRCACSSASVESSAGPRIGRKAASVGGLFRWYVKTELRFER